MDKRLNPVRKRMGDFFHSIRFRLTLWTVAILAVILVIFSGIIYYRQLQDLQIEAQNHLQLKYQQVQTLYRVAGLVDAEGDHFQPPDLTSNGFSALDAGEVLALIGPDGHLVQSAGEITNPSVTVLLADWQQASRDIPPGSTAEYTVFISGKSKDVRYEYLISPMFMERHPIGVVILGQPIDPQSQLPRLLITLLLASISTLVIALAGGYWIASRAMAPVRVITRTARGISDNDMHQRLNLQTKDELGELANTFDAMLARLEAAFERQRQFTADASHELRTPLTIVGLEADHALERQRAPEDYQRAIKIIQSENESMARLVNDLLTLARMDAGQTHLRHEPVDLSDLALDVTERLNGLARRQGIELTTGELPPLPMQGDRLYLSQMLTNLVENAIKYAGTPGKHVCIHTGLLVEGISKYGWVRVEDDGPGIPPDALPHLFDRFYRVDKARTHHDGAVPIGSPDDSPDGSGLGLSIVQWIAQAHKGQVSVQSEVGKGSVFEVRLPV
ncbi:MAG: ATP-binding protein [Anaerolineaceae bacterium]|nr:ATP-binding protein [Anaerolineaceae bacterium]